jgi:hypothetical protein
MQISLSKRGAFQMQINYFSLHLKAPRLNVHRRSWLKRAHSRGAGGGVSAAAVKTGSARLGHAAQSITGVSKKKVLKEKKKKY